MKSRENYGLDYDRLRIRSFHQLLINSQFGIIFISSEEREKLINVYECILFLPPKFGNFFPLTWTKADCYPPQHVRQGRTMGVGREERNRLLVIDPVWIFIRFLIHPVVPSVLSDLTLVLWIHTTAATTFNICCFCRPVRRNSVSIPLSENCKTFCLRKDVTQCSFSWGYFHCVFLSPRSR